MGVRLATLQHFERDRTAQHKSIGDVLGEDFQQPDLFEATGKDIEFLGLTILHVDRDFGLIGLANVGRQRLLPRPGGIAEVALTGPLPLLRHLG